MRDLSSEHDEAVHELRASIEAVRQLAEAGRAGEARRRCAALLGWAQWQIVDDPALLDRVTVALRRAGGHAQLRRLRVAAFGPTAAPSPRRASAIRPRDKTLRQAREIVDVAAPQ